jgi:hypothetical protein
VDPKDVEKALKLELKFRAYVACGWGLMVLFAMMGVILGRPQGAVMAAIIAVTWVILRIVHEAFDSLRMLRGMKAEEAAPPKDDDKSPPGPLAGA